MSMDSFSMLLNVSFSFNELCFNYFKFGFDSLSLSWRSINKFFLQCSNFLGNFKESLKSLDSLRILGLCKFGFNLGYLL